MKELKPIKVRGKTDPRRPLFIKHYLDRYGETFSNAYQSALKAGYGDEYAQKILQANWISGQLHFDRMIAKAEKVLEECLEMDTKIMVLQSNGKKAELVERVDASLSKIKQDTAKFVSERIGKFNEKSQLNVKSEGLSKIAKELKSIAKEMQNEKL